MICSCNKKNVKTAKFCVECGNAFCAAPVAKSTKKLMAVTAIKSVGRNATGTAKFVSRTAKEGAQSELGKSIGLGALVGAAIGAPLPLVGPALGASVGALMGAWRKF